MDSRSINFNVLRRHDSKITSIIDSTSYVVIYRYFHGAWSKTGLEGTMFIFERDLQNDLPRYGVFVLNRQGLDNMSQGLLSGWEVDLDEGLIIWRNEGATGDADDDIIHGLWIYEEPDRSRIASVMQSLIDLSTPQSEPEPEPTTSSPQVSLSHPVPRVPIIPPGQSISLDQLFGVGSVCSEVPPSTSDLPHPASSIADSTEHQTSLPPQHVMSPDPSDLPKGMQLLDSLFQKASLKTQISNPSISTNDSIPQQSIGIHQLLQTQSISPNPLQNNPNSGSSSTHHHHHHHHRRNSSDENYKPQSYNEVNRNPTHKAHIHHRAPNSNSNSKSKSGQAQSSRHSSGGSSSHPRSEKMGTQNSNGHTYPIHQNPQYQSTQAVLVSDSQVSNESAHAEARHNILSLLGHPIATSAPNHNHHHNLVTGPISNSGSWNGVHDGSPDSIKSSGVNRDVYQPSSYGRNLQTKYNQQEVNSNLRSQQTSQHSSPQQNHSPHSIPYTHSQPAPPVSNQAEIGSPNSSGGSHHHHLSRNGSQFYQQVPTNHSQVKVRGTPPKPPLPNIPIQTRQSQNSGVNHVWNVESYPKRALSPLNPASQRSQQSQGSQQPQPQQQVSQQWNGVQQIRKTKAGEIHAPIVNDSSRPNRTKSFNQSIPNKEREGKMIVNKIVAEVLDEGLSKRESKEEENLKKNEREDEEDEALDKREFVNGVLELIKNNGAFVDMLYARYLARYAERYL